MFTLLGDCRASAKALAPQFLFKRKSTMHLEKRWIYIVFVLVLFPAPAYSQLVNLAKLGDGGRNFRLGYARDFGTHGMWVGTDRGFGDRTKISTSAIIFFRPTDPTVNGVYESSQLVHIAPLGSTGIDCFFFGDLGVFIERSSYSRSAGSGVSNRILRYLSISDVWLGGGGGLSKTFGQFTPFLSLFYQRLVYSKEEIIIPWYGALSVGAEIELTQHIDLTGRVDNWYESEFGFISPPSLYIGLSLH